MKNRKLRSLLISLGVIIGLLIIVAGAATVVIRSLLAAGIVSQSDITSTLVLGSKYFIAIGIVLLLIIVLLIVFWKRESKFQFWLKWESLIVFLVTIVVSMTSMIFGPMQGLMNANNAGTSINSISKELSNDGNQLTQQISSEGTTLLQNTKGYLPIKAKKVNVFGWASTSPFYGGTGSGSGNTSKNIDIYQSLKDAGFTTNQKLYNFYHNYRKSRPSSGSILGADWTLPEPKGSQYSKSLINQTKKFSDTAIVVLSRSGGEGNDLPTDMRNMAANQTYHGRKDDFNKGQSYLEIDNPEKEMLKLVNQNFKNVIVVVNSANSMELGWLKNYSHIKAALWMAGTGAQGFEALGKILKGEINPSGRTTDTYVYNLKNTPTYNNFGSYYYSGQEAAYVHETENIFVGYKYWETRYLNNQKGYRQHVQYPFGYGLSYTTFKQSMSKLNVNKSSGEISFNVTVKNTGRRSGKDVVQVYYTAPYYNGGIEKSATNLLDFAKTKNLKPGESQTIKFSFNRAEMSSYDEKDGGHYVLDRGEYQIQIKNNSHSVIATRNYNLSKKITYNTLLGDSGTTSNQFQYAENDGSNFTYLSRKNNFANYKEATKAPSANTKLKSNLLKTATLAQNYKNTNSSGSMPSQNQNNNLVLSDLRGKSYNNSKWNKLINQMSVSDMGKLITYGGYQTFPIRSIGKIGTHDFDGPAGFNSLFASVTSKLNTTSFPTEVMLASTWSKQLAKKYGEQVGKEGKQANISGWYGPAMNLHRSAFGGRNFEYFSEDPKLSGFMASNEISGAKKYGVYSYIKHFAMNEQETNRFYIKKDGSISGLMTWNTEQAIREAYLKPFRMAVENGGASAAMTSYSMIGNRWSGANKQLLQNILRKEWGFKGLTETDYFAGGFLNANESILNGGDLMLSTLGNAQVTDTSNPKVVKAMRRASHNILYTVANSNAYAKGHYHKGQSVLWNYQQTLIRYIIVVAVILLLLQILVVFLYRRKYVKKS
ncbi:beta-glucosidase [Lactobacillus corticis]|uniref:Beta-glucosidase n=1 Tax=Lactobacillus corticis TaxID=2201249 RepID=A0A916QJZ5_9LACO|nr:glycoside hydrolase family 3 C-terminal domain-containing protein [Lactobacillus corticis]GFZ27093.1 beta-glucosidase [Lactobacillus corticis]